MVERGSALIERGWATCHIHPIWPTNLESFNEHIKLFMLFGGREGRKPPMMYMYEIQWIRKSFGILARWLEFQMFHWKIVFNDCIP
jgi:hypothetical protein